MIDEDCGSRSEARICDQFLAEELDALQIGAAAGRYHHVEQGLATELDRMFHRCLLTVRLDGRALNHGQERTARCSLSGPSREKRRTGPLAGSVRVGAVAAMVSAQRRGISASRALDRDAGEVRDRVLDPEALHDTVGTKGRGFHLQWTIRPSYLVSGRLSQSARQPITATPVATC